MPEKQIPTVLRIFPFKHSPSIPETNGPLPQFFHLFVAKLTLYNKVNDQNDKNYIEVPDLWRKFLNNVACRIGNDEHFGRHSCHSSA